GTSGAVGTTKFGFMSMPPAPVIFETSPKGDVNQANNLITVAGANFLPGAVIQLPGPPAAGPTFITLATTFVNSGTLQGTTVAGMLAGEQDVYVVNPDTQTTLLHQFYTTCGPALAPWTKNLPAQSTGYEIFSAPQYSSVSSLTAALETSLGPYNPFFYRVFFWKSGQYVELNQMTNDTDLSGRAFWALTRNGGSLTISGLDCFANAVSGIRVIPLDPGWNLISLPYQNGGLLGMNWTQVQVTADGAAWSGAGPADGTPALLNPLLYVFLNGNYQAVNALVAGEGYFVYNPTGSRVYLLFNAAQLVTPAIIPYGVRVPLAAGAPVPPGPPSQGPQADGSGSSGGCGILGPEFLLWAAAFHHLGRRRRLRA
ncbi:MAG TPA: hypothetical protein VEN81_11415, partial [Planctomycetota bacterium]|nr:hypothetical protein [Planctomycetota bacterium]